MEAQYLYGEYRYIPTKAENTVIMNGNMPIVNVDKYPTGIITSKNYPVWEEFSNYTLNLVSENPEKAIRLYVTDMFMEEHNKRCDAGYLELDDKVINSYFQLNQLILNKFRNSI